MPNRIDRFFGRGPIGVAPIWAGHGGWKEAFHEASCDVSSCWKTDLGKVCRPKSPEEIELVWSALWNTLGQAKANGRDEQNGVVTSPAPTTWMRCPVDNLSRAE